MDDRYHTVDEGIGVVSELVIEATLRSRMSRYLPSDMLNGLPEPRVMADAVRHLNSMYQTFSSFLPSYVSENEALYTKDAGYLREGTFMFADVSGFTALSERLQTLDGREGAETLTKIINDYFATMLEILAKSTGTLLKFAGDALLAFFPASANEFESPKAIRAGLRMQRAMKEKFQPIKNALLTERLGDHGMELTMSVGIVRGRLFEAMVGSTIQRDHIIQGDLPRRADQAEGVGVRDDVIIDTALYELCKGEFEAVEIVEGFYRVVDNLGDSLDDFEFQMPSRRRAKSSALFGFEVSDLLTDLQNVVERVEGVASFIAPEVVNKLIVRGDHIESENRPATVMFVFFAGFGKLLELWGEEQLEYLVSILDRYYSSVQRIVSSYGGSLTRSDPYKDGSKLLITFGAPVAHEDDPDRAVATALEMQRQLQILNERIREEIDPTLRPDYFPYITQRMGISQGQVFAGEVGWRSRREYTVMGDDVNLAARLMGGGEMGQITISERVWQRVDTFFETEALPPRQFKGKSKPMPIFLVTGEKTDLRADMDKTSDTPFIGRDSLLLTITLALQQAKGPRRRRAIALYGDAGIGKTRVARKLAYDAKSLDFTVAMVACRSQDDRKTMWASLIAQLLNFQNITDEQLRRGVLAEVLLELNKSELLNPLSDLMHEYLGDPTIEYLEEESKSEFNLFQTSLYSKASRAEESRPTGLFRMADQILDHANSLDQAPRGSSTELALWKHLANRTSVPESVVEFIRAYAMKTPTLLIIDDLHRANPYAITVLNKVVQSIKIGKLVILVTYEPTEALDLGIQASELTDLQEQETYLMGTTILNAVELGPRLAAFLWERTSGRPLFIESLLHALQENDQLTHEQGVAELCEGIEAEALPDNVRELVISQLDRLPTEYQQVLRVAAVLDEGIHAMYLEQVDPTLANFPLDEILAALVKIQILVHPDGQTYSFRHGVTQTTVYTSLNRFQRQKLHRNAADYWTKQGNTDKNIILIAHHYVKGGVPMRAIELIAEAAGKAEAADDIEGAIELYTRAQAIFPLDESLRFQVQRLQAKL